MLNIAQNSERLDCNVLCVASARGVRLSWSVLVNGHPRESRRGKEARIEQSSSRYNSSAKAQRTEALARMPTAQRRKGGAQHRGANAEL